MSPNKQIFPINTNAGRIAALRSAACQTLGIPDHPVTVKTTVIQAPRTGQYFITVLEITEGPLRAHVLKVDGNGDVVRHRYNSLKQ